MSPRHPHQLDDAITSFALAAGVANVIMQLSWPEIGYGVKESKVTSGSVLHHPLKRARTTFTYLSVALWGTDDERRDYRSAVNSSHRHVRSDDDSPVSYNAFDPELQLWVAACLYRGIEDVHNALYPQSRFRGERGIYEACAPLATTLQVRDGMWPADREAFEVFWQRGLRRVSIDEPMRRHLDQIATMAMMPAPVRWLGVPPLHFLTRGFLHPEFRDAMHYDWTDGDQRRFDRVMALAAIGNSLSPAPLRMLSVHVYLNDFRLRRRLGLGLV